MTFTRSEFVRQWGAKVRELRDARRPRLTIEKLAEMADMDPGHLSKFERGLAGVSEETKVRLAAALDTQVSEIFVYPDTVREAAG